MAKNTTTTKASKSAKASKPAKASKSAKVEKVNREPAGRHKADLNGSNIRILSALRKSPIPMTRAELSAVTGINKGWSRLLGAATKEDGGVAGSDSLEAKGYVTNRKVEDERAIQYSITASGRKALDKAEKKAK